ncbi:MAG: response regulator [Deltaproteobacteria bacterium]|nr:response regulator [Deltaproteobacteria bacterium]
MNPENHARTRSVRRQLHLVGPAKVVRRIRMSLAMYPQLVTAAYATLEELREDQKRSHPDLVVAVLESTSWGGRLLAAEHPLSIPIVLAIPHSTPELLAFAQASGCYYVEGPRGLGPRVTSRVARALGLGPRKRPEHDLLGPIVLTEGSRKLEAVLQDAAPHALLVRGPELTATDEGKPATLHCLRAAGPLELHGTIDLADSGSKLQFALVRLDDASQALFAPVVWGWTQQAIARRAEEPGELSEQWVTLSRTARQSARVQLEGATARHYFRLAAAGAGKLRLKSSGNIPTLTSGKTITIDVQTRRGPVALTAQIVEEHVTPGESGKPETHELVVAPADTTPEARQSYDRLLRYLGIELKVSPRKEDLSRTYELVEAAADEVDQFITPEEFAQHHEIRLTDVTRTARRLGIGRRLHGRRVFRESDILDAMRHHISRVNDLRQRKLHFHVLAVDDDVENVEAIERILRKDYRVFTATSGEEALEIFKKETIEVIITDQRMPGMTGTDLLRKTLELNPNVIRIILSAYTDASALTDAINTAKAHHFLHKPIAREELLSKVQAAFAALRAQKHVRAIELGRSVTI